MRSLDEAMKAAGLFVVVVSRNFLSSNFCQVELGSIAARAAHDPSTRIIPILLDDVKDRNAPQFCEGDVVSAVGTGDA